jgi:hypothetical protein
VIDAIASGLVSSLFVRQPDLSGPVSHLPGSWSLLALFIDYVVGIVLVGRSLGLYLSGLRVIRVVRQVAVGPLRAAGRTLLLIVLIPALVTDTDFRGLHDRLTSTAVIVH